MPTPAEGYWLDGKRLPSVTTVLYPYQDGGSDGLIMWSIKLLLEDMESKLPITSMEQIPTNLHVLARDKAGEIGTMAHNAIEWYAKGGEYAFEGDPEIVEPAKVAYGAFLKWARKNNFIITHTELRLTSALYRYGGTLDVAGLVHGLRELGDWKTSNYIKKTMIMQLAAYRNLWNENYPDDKVVDCNLIRFDKNTGMFDHKCYPGPMLDKAFKLFLLLLEIYQGIKELKI